jgi:hypothetical protein
MTIRLKAIAAMILLAGALLFPRNPLGAQWRQVQLDDSDMAADLAEALTFVKYPTYPQYVEMMAYFAGTYPEICRLDTFGRSQQGRLLLALKISDNAQMDEPEARFLYTSTMHGDELVGYPLMLRLISTLLTRYGSDSEVSALVDNLAIWINPLANPDGTYYPDNDTSVACSIREAPGGRDLNRDFPDPSLPEADDTTGRAPETRAMMEFLRKQRFTLSANIHSGEEVVNYPWDHTYDLHADDGWFRFVSREYADEARAADPGYMALFTDGITNGAEWYRIYGGRQDYVNYYLGGREITLELSHDYRLPSAQLDAYWQKNERSLLNYMAQCMYGIRGRVTDLSSGEPLAARIAIPGHDSAYSVACSGSLHGDFYRLIDQGSYDVVASADGYLDDTIRGVSVTRYRSTWLELRLQAEKLTDTGPGRADQEMSIYPNPFSDLLYIRSPGTDRGTLTVKVHSMTGSVLYHRTIPATGGTAGISLGHLSPGLYLLEVGSPDGTTIFRIQKL